MGQIETSDQEEDSGRVMPGSENDSRVGRMHLRVQCARPRQKTLDDVWAMGHRPEASKV